MADSNGSQVPAWAWLMTGVVAGLFLAFLYYLAGVKIPENSQKPAETAANDGKKAPKFDFYTVLPDVEVLEDKTPANKTSSGSATTKPPAAKRVIQTGSFQNLQDADRRRAQLLLLGLEVQTQKVEVNSGQVFHRVQVGPFSDTASLEAARKTLTENQIEHIVLTLK